MNHQELLDGLVKAQPATKPEPTQAEIDKRLGELQAEFPRKWVKRTIEVNSEYGIAGNNIYEVVEFVRPTGWLSQKTPEEFARWAGKYVGHARAIEPLGDGWFVVGYQKEWYSEPSETGRRKEARDKILRDNQAVAGEPMLKVGYIVQRSGQKFITHRFKATEQGLEAVKLVLEKDQYQHGNTQHEETVCNYVDHLDPKTHTVTPVFRGEWKTFKARGESLVEDKPRVIGWGWSRD